MIREMLAPRALVIFFIMWGLLTWGILHWNKASKAKHKSWLKRAYLPVISGAIALLIMAFVAYTLG